MGVLDRLRGRAVSRATGIQPFSFDEWLQTMTYGGNVYSVGLNQTLVGNQERVGAGFTAYVDGALKSNGVVFACMVTRMMLFSEARFQFRQLRAGKPGNLFGNADLSPLEHPWPGGTTGDLLTRTLQFADLAGNSFSVKRGGRIRSLRPDWTVIVLGSRQDPEVNPWDIEAEVLGYLYQPGGPAGGRDPEPLLANEVAHFAPYPDPLSPWRGMSWLTPVIREIEADSQMTTHKQSYLTQGATPNMLISLKSVTDPDAFQKWEEIFRDKYEGSQNAYKTMLLGGGADATVVGGNFQQLDFKATQGSGETRIAAASGIHPVVIGLSEGMQGSSLNAGNFGAARRITADKCLRPLWRNICGSFERIVPPPTASQLWYDEADIPFLREDATDAAKIEEIKAGEIKILTDAGFEAQSVVDAVTASDLSRLSHTGLFSVQLQPPNMPQIQPVQNGNGVTPTPASVP